MILITIKVVLLLSSIIMPLSTRKKAQPKANLKPRVDTDTKNAVYAINENGLLEKIQRASVSDH